jgi:hypothetical protein
VGAWSKPEPDSAFRVDDSGSLASLTALSTVK